MYIESDFPWIKNGDEIDFTIQSFSRRSYEGKVKFIDPLINAKTRVAQVRVELANRNLELKPEMIVNGILSFQMACTKGRRLPSKAYLRLMRRHNLLASQA